MKLIKNCKIGKNTKICDFVNLYDCEIGDDCLIGTFVEIQNSVKIGNNVRIQSHTFICEKVTIENNIFIGHGVIFTNAKHHSMKTYPNHETFPTLVKKGVTIGSNATILPVTIGENSIIGAGSVVTKNVLQDSIVVGNPAKVLNKVKNI